MTSEEIEKYVSIIEAVDSVPDPVEMKKCYLAQIKFLLLRIRELEDGIRKHKVEKEQTSILSMDGRLLPVLDESDEELYKLLEKK